jgi:AmmeMemoRadiSam system protein B/AmmeMemoRadiSam system protein A
MLNKAEHIKIDGKIRGIISPHAGYIYSGKAAASGYAAIRGQKIKRVIILAPSHYYYLRGASIAPYDYYRTPLGDIPLDRKTCDSLLMQSPFVSEPAAHTREHSIEIQLPFIQRILNDFQIVPILIGEIKTKDYKSIVTALEPFIDDETIIIASSDFTHQGPRFGYQPYKTDQKTKIPELDGRAFAYIEKLDAKGFADLIEETGMTVCGYRSITILLDLMKNTKVVKVDYYTSGDVTGDWTNSVSYYSILFVSQKGKSYRGAPPPEIKQNPNKERTKDNSKMSEDANLLNEKEKATALKIARDTLTMWVEEQKRPTEIIKKYKITDSLKEKRGVFVTLTKNDQLRGCIGHVIGRLPLYEGIMENAINASTNDPRFNPVIKSELNNIHIEISVMTPLTPVKTIDEIEVGVHGLMMENGYYRGLLLPQVATEWGWNREEFLENTCRKAGMNKDCWKDKKTVITKFSAQVFGE